MKFILIILAFASIITAASCGANVFSVFNPTDPSTVSDVNTLLAMGDSKLSSLDYTNAFLAYNRVLTLSPTNSRALEGVSTCYINLQIPLTNLLVYILDGAYSNLNLNKVYNIGAYVSPKLGQIINGQADGVIKYNDMNINISYFMFNTLYAICYMADGNNNMQVQNDTNDWVIINSDFSISNRLESITNTANPFVSIMAAVNSISIKRNYFTNTINNSVYSLNLIKGGLSSSNALGMVDSIASSLDFMLSNISNVYVMMDSYQISNGLNFVNVTDITNYLTIFGTNGYTNLLSQLQSNGVTNISDLTNYIPDLTNYIDAITNYFNITNF